MTDEEIFLSILLLNANSYDRGGEIDLKGLIIANEKKFLRGKYLKKVYYTLLSCEDNVQIPLNCIILLLVRNYIKFNYKDNKIIRYLNKSNPGNICMVFKNNEEIAIELLRSYYQSLKEKDINLSNEQKKLTEKYNALMQVEFLNDKLRHSFEDVYNALVSGPLPNEECPQMMFLIILGIAKIFDNGKLENSAQLLHEYRHYLPRLIYADIYEDIVASDMFEEEDKAVVKIVKEAIALNEYGFSKNMKINEFILSYFAYLCTSPDRRAENRMLLNSENKRVLKKISPLYPFDESGIMNER